MSEPVNLTGETMRLPVSAEQAQTLAHDLFVNPDRLTVTHTVTVGPHVVPGRWVVSAVNYDSDGHGSVLLTRMED